MEKYYDYAQEKFVEGDPTTALTASVLGLELLKRQAHRRAEERERENAAKAAEDTSADYEIAEHNGIQYIRELLRESFEIAATWSDRLTAYNEAFVDYLNRKSYKLKLWHKPEHYALSVKEYKEIVKYEASLTESD